jgi:hypothetical protein
MRAHQRLKARSRKLFLLCEFKQPFRQLVTGFEDKNESFRGVIDLSGLHCSSSIRIRVLNHSSHCIGRGMPNYIERPLDCF